MMVLVDDNSNSIEALMAVIVAVSTNVDMLLLSVLLSCVFAIYIRSNVSSYISIFVSITLLFFFFSAKDGRGRERVLC